MDLFTENYWGDIVNICEYKVFGFIPSVTVVILANLILQDHTLFFF